MSWVSVRSMMKKSEKRTGVGAKVSRGEEDSVGKGGYEIETESVMVEVVETGPSRREGEVVAGIDEVELGPIGAEDISRLGVSLDAIDLLLGWRVLFDGVPNRRAKAMIE